MSRRAFLVFVWAGSACMLGARLPGAELVVSQDPGVTRLAIAGFAPFHATDREVEQARLIDTPDSPLPLVLDK